MVVVDFPSPRGVGVIPATHTYLPVFLLDNLSRVLRETLAFFFPYRSTSDGRRPISEARRSTSLGVCARATSISEGTFSRGLSVNRDSDQEAFWVLL